jgi:hypothetical protein
MSAALPFDGDLIPRDNHTISLDPLQFHIYSTVDKTYLGSKFMLARSAGNFVRSGVWS